VKYPYQGVLQNNFADPMKCFVRGMQMFDNTPLGMVPTSVKVELMKSMSSTLGVNITSNIYIQNKQCF